MKKILVLFLVLFLPLAAFAQEPLSQEVLDQAKLQAGLFLELKNALGLAWMDDYNAYLEDPANSPQPAWATSVQDLINDSYLSETFPTDFVITPTGQEVTISRTITSQAIKDVLPIYLPSVAIAGNTVSLLVQRPEQWVAWEAGLLGKVSRDGSDDPDILPNSVLDFGKSSEIKFVNNDGKITGVNSLIYKTQELDSRFINVSGDNMTGDLTIKGNKAWHAGNDGTGSGLDADLLDGQHGSFYQNASNLSAGIVPPDRLKGQTYKIDILGNATTATYASNSDKLDGCDESDFAKASHPHGEYLNKTNPAGDTMVGPLGVNFESGITSGIGSHNIKGTGSTNVVGKGFKIDWDTDFGFVGLVDKGADRKDMVFANEQTGDNFVFMSQGMEIMALKPASKTLEIDGNTVWHAGNDGSGSGLDADKVDGKDKVVGYEVRIPAGANLNNYTEPGMYYCPSNADAKTIANRPTDNAFSLLVEQHAGVKQTLTEYLPTDTARVWFRNYYNGTWGPWIKAANVVEKIKTVTGSWYIGPHDKHDGGRNGGSLCRGGHRRRYYFAPNYNASGAKQWYTFDELMTWGGIKSQTDAVGIENVLSAKVNISANGCWETSASVQILERDPNTGAVTTLASGSVRSGSIVRSCTIRKGYQYNIKATLGVPTECYDDGYGAHLWATSYTYKYYVVQ